MWFDKPLRKSFFVFKNTKNYIKQRMFLGNILTREARPTLLTTNGIIFIENSRGGLTRPYTSPPKNVCNYRNTPFGLL